MALPRKEVVFAVYESYINIRAPKWGLKYEEEFKLPAATIPAKKILTVIDILTKVQAAETPEDWISIVFEAYQQELHEKKSRDESYFYSFTDWLGVTDYIADKPLSLLTHHTGLTYIISKLYDHPAFLKAKEKLQEKKTEDENARNDDIKLGYSEKIIKEKEKEISLTDQQIKALCNSKKAPESFFAEIITQRDPKYKELKAKKLEEKSFADFESNAISGVRPLHWCKKLLDFANKDRIKQQQRAIPTSSALTVENEKEERKQKHLNSPLPNHVVFFKESPPPPVEPVKPARQTHGYNTRHKKR